MLLQSYLLSQSNITLKICIIVNAWTQKKGSALFEKPPEDLDAEEDEMIKLALEESLKTAELDKLRNMERWVVFTLQ